ncbi:hypothetical protein AB0B89_23760 [Sphaerisporangium sp. NPDC049002]|uniref:hypothetical protein n=1 Tax=Sphaerisporangium sp. NPDC049002 TaxID=3155392 RepID=UPI003404055F
MSVFPDGLIRPWYPAGAEGHAYADCEHLLAVEPEPREGSGWLDPRGPGVCLPCLTRLIPPWDADCGTCKATIADDRGVSGAPFSEVDARRWEAEHQCEPKIRLVPPPSEPAPAATDGQTALFASHLEDAAA